MIIVPGQAGKDLCDPQLGMTRRDILRVGGSGLLGMSLGSMLELQAVSARPPNHRGHAAAPAGARPRASSWSTSRAGPAISTSGTPRRTSPTTSERVQEDLHQGARHQRHGDAAQAGPDHRQVHLHPLDELHPQRPVQPHRRHLPDDDRLHDRQGQPVGPARAAQPQGLPQLRLAHHPAEAPERAHAAVRDAAPPAPGEQRRRQGGHRRASWARPSIPTPSSPTATTWT